MRRIFIAIICCIAFVAPTVHASVVSTPRIDRMTNGLVGYWTMDGPDVINGVIVDKSGQNNRGNLISIASSTFFSAGKIGQAFNFDGVNDKVNVLDANSLDVGTGNFAFSFWMKSPSGGVRSIFGKGVGSVSWYFQDIGSNNFRFRIADGVATAYGGQVLMNIYDNKWHHIVISVTRSSANVDYYLDGVAQAITGNSGGLSAVTGSLDNTDNFTIGTRSTDQFWYGSIDEFRFYNRALTAAEVTTLYNMGAQAYNVSASLNSRLTSGLVAYWSLDGKDMPSGRVTDVSGNGNTGSLIGISTSTFYTAGKIGQGIRFDGSDDTINVGSGATIDDIQAQGGGGMTLAFWIKSDSNVNKTLFDKGNAGNNTGTWRLHKSNSSNPARINFNKEGGTDASVSYNGVLPNNVWTHLVVTWDGSMTLSTGFNLYKNGVVQTQTVTTDGVTANSEAASTMFIGSLNGASDFCDCSMDDIRIYNRVLSTSEINALYAMGNQAGTMNGSRNDHLTSGLAGLWSFDGPDMLTNVRDVSGQGNNGSMLNFGATSTAQSPGRIGQGLNFDGVDDAILTSTNSIGTGDITVTAWIKPRSVGENNLGTIVTNGAFYFATRSTNTLEVRNNNNTLSSGSSNFISPNTWQFVTATRSGTNIGLYVNGVSGCANNCATNDAPAAGSTNVYIGNRSAGDRTFDGTMDDVRIYNRVLTQAEISTLYNLGR